MPRLAAFADQVQTARSRTEYVGTDWNIYSQAIGTALQAALTGEAAPEDALARAQSQVEAELRSRT